MTKLKKEIIKILNKPDLEPLYTEEGLNSFINQLLSLIHQEKKELLGEVEKWAKDENITILRFAKKKSWEPEDLSPAKQELLDLCDELQKGAGIGETISAEKSEGVRIPPRPQENEQEFDEGEKSMARGVLRRIESGRDLGHIKLLCQAVAKELPNLLKDKKV